VNNAVVCASVIGRIVSKISVNALSVEYSSCCVENKIGSLWCLVPVRSENEAEQRLQVMTRTSTSDCKAI